MMASVVFHMKGDQRFLSKDLRSDTPIQQQPCPADLRYAQVQAARVTQHLSIVHGVFHWYNR